MFKTKEIIKATGAKIIGKNPPDSFEGISQHSKTIQKNELFIALCGQRLDGHQFLGEAFEKGAHAAIVQKGKGSSKAFPGKILFEVKDTLTALGDLARHHRKKFSIPMIGITGSNGKTTTKELIASLLQTRFNILKSQGNQNNLVGLPFSLFKLNSTHEIAILEFGMSIPFEIERLSDIAHPTAGLVTNIGEAHLKTMISKEETAKAKTALFRFLSKAWAKKGVSFINLDDPYLGPYAKKLRSDIRTYSLEDPKADVFGEIVEERGISGVKMRVSLKSHSFSFFLSLAGRHNAMNAVAAVAVGAYYSLEFKKMKEALESFQAMEGRSKIISLKKGLVLIDDCYNANPSSMAEGLKLLKSAADSPPEASTPETFAVLGDMLELGPHEVEYHQKIGRLVAQLNIDNLLTYGPLSQYIEKIAKQENERLSSFSTLDQTELISELKRRLSSRADVIVLVKGSRGMNMERVIESLQESLKGS